MLGLSRASRGKVAEVRGFLKCTLKSCRNVQSFAVAVPPLRQRLGRHPTILRKSNLLETASRVHGNNFDD